MDEGKSIPFLGINQMLDMFLGNDGFRFLELSTCHGPFSLANAREACDHESFYNGSTPAIFSHSIRFRFDESFLLTGAPWGLQIHFGCCCTPVDFATLGMVKVMATR